MEGARGASPGCGRTCGPVALALAGCPFVDCAFATAVADYLAKQGKQPKAFSLQRNAKIEPNQINELLKLKPEVLINTVLSGPASEISRQLISRGLTIPMSSLSFVGAQQYISSG